MIRTFAVLAVLALVLPATQADTVRLRTGGTIDGIVTEDGGDYVIEVQYGTMRVGKELVDSVDRKETPLSEHKRRAAALAEDDADGWYKLGQWAQRSDLERLAQDDFARAVAIKPDHEAARAALGYEKVDGKWMTRDEVMASKGMVLVDGKWMSKEGAELMKALAEARALEAEAREAEARRQAEEARAERAALAAEQDKRIADLREQELQRQASRRRSYYDDYSYPYGGQVLFYPGTYYYRNPYRGCHNGTPYVNQSSGRPVTIERSGGQDVWVEHSGGCANDNHTQIHSDGDGHLVSEQIVNGRQVLVHQVAPGATPDIELEHR